MIVYHQAFDFIHLYTSDPNGQSIWKQHCAAADAEAHRLLLAL
jgi:hypothetical protein